MMTEGVQLPKAGNSRSTGVFSDGDYYPVPSQKVITYAKDTGDRSIRQIIAADLNALIVSLTSPLDDVEYELFADFFLIYRNFICPDGLLDLLVKRFMWCMEELLNGVDEDHRVIGQITLVRTFVLIRHWVINYFAQDFLQNLDLRERVITFLNSLYQTGTELPKIITNIIVSLKKSWVYTVRFMWDDADLEKEFSLNSFGSWLRFNIMDVTKLQTAKGEARDSRLSFYALQSSTNPSFRNESILSLYKPKDNFQLPTRNKTFNLKHGIRIKKRTASMFLYPQDNLSACYWANKSDTSGGNKCSFAQAQKRILSHISNATNVSTVIKEVAYPSSPKVESVIPPTPSKGLEFILNSSCPLTAPFNNDKFSHKFKPKYHQGYRIIAGLISKWKMNHSFRNKGGNVSNNVEPEMNNLIKYVFSITSLDYSRNDMREISESVPSKFDILSARTIEEVEYLITVENEIVDKLEPSDADISYSETRNILGPIKNYEAFRGHNVIDNLNLYNTVNTIANSVISLSRSVSLKQQNAMSPSLPVLEPRRPHSLATFRSDSSKMLLTDALLGTRRHGELNKLIFSENDTHRKPGSKIPSFKTNTLETSGCDNLEEHSKSSFNIPSNCDVNGDFGESFISKITYDSQTNDVTMDKTCVREKHPHSISKYNAQNLNRKTNHPNLREFMFETSIPEVPTLSSKNNKSSNIAELNKWNESNDADLESIAGHKSSVSAISLGEDSSVPEGRLFKRKYIKQPVLLQVEASESEPTSDFSSPIGLRGSADSLIRKTMPSPIPVPPNTVTQNACVSPASGRISIIKKPGIGPRRSPITQSPVVTNDPSFIERDSVFAQHEASLTALEEDLKHSIAVSELLGFPIEKSETKSTISTAMLLASAQASPRKQSILNESIEEEVSLEISDPRLINLSSTPSIQSLISNGMSLNSADSIEIQSLSSNAASQASNISRDRFNRSKFVSHADSLLSYINENGNKYIFSTEVELTEETSPKRDMEYLKTRFMGQNESDHEIESSPDLDISDMISTLKRVKIAPFPSSSPPTKYPIEEVTIDKVPSTSQAAPSGNSDPVALALMKLEGTFAKTAERRKDGISNPGSANSSILAREVENLEIAGWHIPPTTNTNKRQSMFIERRRTMAETSYSDTCDQSQRSFNRQIRELLENYKVQDTRLNISNKEQHVPFILMYDSLSIAKQMTLIEREVMSEIDWKDLLDLNMRKSLPKITSWLQLLLYNEEFSGIDLAIARFNLTVDWIISELVMTVDSKLRRNVIQRLIHVAEHCRKFQNYNTVMEIVLALNSVVVQKFTDSWRLVEPADMLTWKELKSIPSLDRNYHNIRDMLNKINPINGCIPFLVVYLSDLALNTEKRDWIIPNKVVNYNKFQTSVQIVKNFIQRVQWAKFYDIEPDEELLSKCVYITSLTHEEIDHLTAF
ncbi:mitotic regulator LTE1 Ecym_7358 [Eremothecium cymbalariae DBVPG|uniref:Guanine nucleotide exchange factor LTE1 n=1 Tax=Eremothecium cymbalariae (strain CBS 270.75 / DBVPG 7215 / KCTC 17166 / NRRL Y-17582) TaxID=931890 RepID=G8JWH1_ERECY|nr:hypothetical protein Ecym_7358 [Eremothecium cymbalariae DBVPG\